MNPSRLIAAFTVLACVGQSATNPPRSTPAPKATATTKPTAAPNTTRPTTSAPSTTKGPANATAKPTTAAAATTSKPPTMTTKPVTTSSPKTTAAPTRSPTVTAKAPSPTTAPTKPTATTSVPPKPTAKPAPATQSVTTSQPSSPDVDVNVPQSSSPHFSFIQITDLHVSDNRPYSLNNLRRFCDTVFPRLVAGGDIRFLVISGDLTDGIGSVLSINNFFGQQEADWVGYRAAMSGCVRAGVPVFKIRGNHDSFGVESFHHASNRLFKEYQAEFRKLSHKNMKLDYHIETGSYAFFDKGSRSRFAFVEATRIVPAPHQYHGEFSEDQEAWLNKWIDGPSNKEADSTYVFAHYPLGSLIPDSRNRFLAAVSGSHSRVTYLSGHIHNVIGKNGAQALHSHGNVDELQLADFKWKGVARKVDISSGLFVDIPTIGSDGSLAATLLWDPAVRDGSKTVVAVHSEELLESAADCSGEQLRLDQTIGNLYVLSPQPGTSGVDMKCVDIVTMGRNGEIGTHQVTPVDTRVWPGTFARFVFTRFFEFLQVLIFVGYLGVVVVAKELFVKHNLRFAPMYLLLSPLLPSLLSEGVAGRRWMLANAVAMIDLESGDVFFESESTRVGVTLLIYLICALGLNWRCGSRTGKLGTYLWTGGLVFLSLFDVRFVMARGGLRTLFLSPHVWFMVYFWYQWIRVKTDKRKTE